MLKRLSLLISDHRVVLVWLSILLLAIALRLYNLSSVPAGLSIDETAIGYNGYAILTQRRDEWLQRLPLTFKSFGEYKPPLAIYSVAISSLFLGPTHFAIRLPMALGGVITVITSYFIARKLLDKQSLALLVMLLVAVSPLNIHFSRIAFESSLGVTLVAVGAAFFLWAADRKLAIRAMMYILSGLSWAVALHSNHATKIVAPLIIMILLWHQREIIRTQLKLVALTLLIVALAIVPLAIGVRDGSGTERLFMTSALFDRSGIKPLPELLSTLFTATVGHLDPQFLMGGLRDTYRHANGVYGIFSSVELFMIIIGTVSIIIKKALRGKHRFLLLISLTAIIPSVISLPSPHANRVHHLIPWIQIVAGVGWGGIVKQLPDKHKVFGWLAVLILIFSQLLWQLPHYYRVYSVDAAREFQFGYREVFEYLGTHEDAVNEVYFTDMYDQAYIYALLYKRVPPISYHHGALIKYRFTKLDWEVLQDKQQIMIVAGPGEVPPSIERDHTVYYPDGSTAFEIIRR
ncbi:MAG: glycosyltransferase family 39 protein [bacterium]|nr:glycosyltransferase family 39 protein [bacterium]